MQNLTKGNPCAGAINKETKSATSDHSFNKRIRSTNYIVGIHFSDSETETVSDKMLRIIKGEMARTQK